MHVVAVFLENLVFIFFSDFANLSPAVCFISGPFCPFAVVGNKFSEVHVLVFFFFFTPTFEIYKMFV